MFGIINDTGQWNGMIGMVSRGVSYVYTYSPSEKEVIVIVTGLFDLKWSI